MSQKHGAEGSWSKDKPHFPTHDSVSLDDLAAAPSVLLLAPKAALRCTLSAASIGLHDKHPIAATKHRVLEVVHLIGSPFAIERLKIWDSGNVIVELPVQNC